MCSHQNFKTVRTNPEMFFTDAADFLLAAQSRNNFDDSKPTLRCSGNWRTDQKPAFVGAK
jgi:hypothetical protein